MAFSDDFSRSGADLGANWTDQVAGCSTNGAEAIGPAGTFGSAFWNAGAFANDQFSEIVIANVVGMVRIYVGVRQSGTGSANGMFLALDGSGTQILLQSAVSGSFTTVGTFATGVTFANGDVYRLSVSGQVYTCTLGGSPVGSPIADGGATFASGSAGIQLQDNASRVTNWAAGDVGGGGGGALPFITVLDSRSY
jgi:hypothetical protein